jgi:hypothetical protein
MENKFQHLQQGYKCNYNSSKMVREVLASSQERKVTRESFLLVLIANNQNIRP